MDLQKAAEIGQRVAAEAGEAILARLGRLAPEALGYKGVRDLVTEADLAAERIVVGALRRAFPDHLVVAEEETSQAAAKSQSGDAMRQDPAARPRHAATDLAPLRERIESARWTWFVDPLDGTTNFAHGHPFFSVSLALYEGMVPAVAVVFAPALGELYVATRGGGARLNGRPLRVSSCERVGDAIFATGFPYRRHELPDLENNIEHLDRFLREVRGFRRGGSAAIDLAFVAAGRFDFYFEAQLEPWDVAAGALLVREAGGTVSDYAGGEDWLLGRRILASNGAMHELARARLHPEWRPAATGD